LDIIESTQSDFHDTSNATTNSSTTTDEINLLTNHIDQDNEITNETNGHNVKPKRRRSTRNRNGSTSSTTLNHEQPIPTDIEQSTTVTKPSSSNTQPFHNNNRKSKIIIFFV
jgi:hypothetical protein